ncbi:MAG: TVP38/TMEM64 family protein [Gammaproteobacteria bacterium]|nr:TVP38/TMEM64 family protein [Gammaproteobacteria bacterium]
MSRLKQWLPLIIILAITVLSFYFGAHKFLNFDALKAHYKQLEMWKHQHYVLMVLAFMAFYIVAVAVSLPGALFITILGGFLFGIIPGTIYVVISATIGASIIFLAVKTALGDWLQGKASGWVSRMEKGFQENAFNYLLSIRFMPIFPFWVINIVPAILNIPLRTYVAATFLGIIPGTAVYVSVGNGLGSLLAAGKEPNLGVIFKPEIIIPIVALAVLSLIPVVVKKIKNRNK